MSVVNSARDVHVDEIVDVEPQSWLNMKEVPAWFISLGVHLLLLLVLASITRITLLDSEHAIISSIEELDQSVYDIDPTIQDVVGSSGDTQMLSPSMSAAPQTSREQQEALQNQLESEIETPEPIFNDELTQPAKEELMASVEVTGETDRPEGGVAGAIDRLTLEIAAAAKEKQLLVVWLFDVSPSVSKRRNEIADRFENVYKQLGILNATENENSLKTAVAAFGATTQIVTKDPVSDVKEVVSQIRSIKEDTSGDENVFAAVNTVTKRWLRYKKVGRRNMMIIVVTDEAGSDMQNLETTIRDAKRNGIKCYVVGNASPFGRREVMTTFEVDGYDIPAIAETGPETVMPERIKLPFWGQNDYDARQLSSGYGPYALTRLCAETNGIYFITQDDSKGAKFEAADMRAYHPDYIPIRDYEGKLQKNAAKAVLVKTAAATQLSKRRFPTPTLQFPASSDNVLRQAITEAQKPVSEVDYGLNELQVMLEQGLNDRKKISEPRWRANYDLALGRVLATRVRAFGYNTVLAEMKSNPKSFENKANNAWRLVPSKEVRSSPFVRKLSKQATELLNGIIDDHPGTPWAYLAAKEMNQPLGWEWKEMKMNLDAKGNRVTKPNPRFEEEQRKRNEALKKRGIDTSKPLKI
ncbi:hypothetical protein Pan241w_53930 [Gimesia alba]|uniref:VWFA domain-containing protein n=1 Tax=Gimesia alba TaxID=2527973 RepID=A0A517RN10_9PLAN|nr:vWA domain-containing protein [Gimesia alba]QDT45273.1 hypothetical protein Pan241w_53930 [Gimesia alba]